MKTIAVEKHKLNAASALITVILYLVGSILAGLIAAIFFGGVQSSPDDRNIDEVIGSGMIANLLVLAAILYVSLWVFRESSHRIFFEDRAINRPRFYYLFPLIWFGVSLFALTQVDFSAFALREILLVLVATLAIGANEEIVDRGILLVGLRNSGFREWLAWLITLIVFSASHLVNLVGGASPVVLIIVLCGGALLYVSRRVFGNIFVPIALHAFYDTAFYLLPGAYLVGENLPDHVLDIQLGSFLVLFVGAVLALIVGRPLFRRETVRSV